MTNIIKNITICLLVTIGVGCKEPGTIGRFKSIPVTNIILDNLGVVDEDPEPYVGARDAVAQDLVPSLTEYVIGPGDILRVSINELYQVDQQWTRQRTEDGRIKIHGMLRARLEKGQRIEPLHLAFCPPFSSDPEFTVHLIDGDAIEFRVTEVACYGARVELRRYASAAGQACNAVLYFEAVAKSSDE